MEYRITVWWNGNDYVEMSNYEIVKLLGMTDVDGDILYDAPGFGEETIHDYPILNEDDKEKYILYNGKLWKRFKKNAPMF